MNIPPNLRNKTLLYWYPWSSVCALYPPHFQKWNFMFTVPTFIYRFIWFLSLSNILLVLVCFKTSYKRCHVVCIHAFSLSFRGISRDWGGVEHSGLGNVLQLNCLSWEIRGHDLYIVNLTCSIMFLVRPSMLLSGNPRHPYRILSLLDALRCFGDALLFLFFFWFIFILFFCFLVVSLSFSFF